MSEALRWDETWHRLREWTDASGKAERLAAQVLFASDFADIDPSHPLGGQDGTRDAMAIYNGQKWIMAVYFPRGQQSFSEIKKKLVEDYAGVAKHAAAGIAFVTNQEVRLAERKELREVGAADNVAVQVFHLERITAVLDRPPMHPIREQFLGIAVPSPQFNPSATRLLNIARTWAERADVDHWDDWTLRLVAGGKTATMTLDRFTQLESAHEFLQRTVLPPQPEGLVSAINVFTGTLGRLLALFRDHGDSTEADEGEVRIAPPQRGYHKAYETFLDVSKQITTLVWELTASANEIMEGVRSAGVDPEFCLETGWLLAGFEQPPRRQAPVANPASKVDL